MATNAYAVQQNSRYQWVILLLCAFTALFTVTLPSMSLPPLFESIGADLNLDLVEIGTIWGILPFGSILFALFGGTLGDRFGARKTLFTICIFTGTFGILRSYVTDFNGLLITTFMMGIAQAIIPVMVFKVVRNWFTSEQLGMASGIISAGFAGGLMLGPLVSTSVLMPMLGGWRSVLVLYGGIAIVIGVLWAVLHPAEVDTGEGQRAPGSLWQKLKHVASLRNIWLLGIGGLGVNACFNGFTGYLPTYLKGVGWAEVDADRALALFFFMSLITVIPMSIIADRFGWRRSVLITGALFLTVGVSLLAFVHGWVILLVVAVTGCAFDTFMAILNASILEVRGVGYLYTGTALGFGTMIRSFGGTFSPPIGNSLAAIAPNLPFLFWGAAGLFAAIIFLFFFRTDREKPSSAA
jgi:MFS family permease